MKLREERVRQQSHADRESRKVEQSAADHVRARLTPFALARWGSNYRAGAGTQLALDVIE